MTQQYQTTACCQRRERENSPYKEVNTRYISSTDPDAAIINRGKSKLSYQVHRAVDQTSEIITATETTPGDVNEAHVMLPLIEEHKTNTDIKADTIVGDSKYGTIENFLTCYDNGMKAHIPDLSIVATKRTEKRRIFTEDKFIYDEQSDTYLSCRKHHEKEIPPYEPSEYRLRCAKEGLCKCNMREQCTENKSGRTIKRHLRQSELDYMRKASLSKASRQDIRTRQHLMERSFAQSKRYGYDRARWRGLWRVKIQEYLTCAIQNIQVLVKHGYNPRKGLAMTMEKAKERVTKVIQPVLNSIKPCIEKIPQRINEFLLNGLKGIRDVGLCC